ncbi:MAG: hypothetical protein AAFN77_05940 [Planctomycetota bacterium]
MLILVVIVALLATRYSQSGLVDAEIRILECSTSPASNPNRQLLGWIKFQFTRDDAADADATDEQIVDQFIVLLSEPVEVSQAIGSEERVQFRYRSEPSLLLPAEQRLEAALRAIGIRKNQTEEVIHTVAWNE